MDPENTQKYMRYDNHLLTINDIIQSGAHWD